MNRGWEVCFRKKEKDKAVGEVIADSAAKPAEQSANHRAKSDREKELINREENKKVSRLAGDMLCLGAGGNIFLWFCYSACVCLLSVGMFKS